MKKLAAITFTSMMLLLATAMVVGAADTVEIRGHVATDSGIGYVKRATAVINAGAVGVGGAIAHDVHVFHVYLAAITVDAAPFTCAIVLHGCLVRI